MQRYSLIDLYAGSGGLSVGFLLSGMFEPLVGVESNASAARTYSANIFPMYTLLKDVEEVTSTELDSLVHEAGYSRLDALVGGPPCRPYSTLNHGRTRWDGTESPEIESFFKLTLALRPRSFVIENVPNLMAAKYANYVAALRTKFLLAGYETIVLRANALAYNVPQSRRRLFIVGAESGRDQGLKESFKHDSCRALTVGEAIADLPRILPGKNGCTFCRYKRGRPTEYQSKCRRDSVLVSDHVTHVVDPVVRERFKFIKPGYNLKRSVAEGFLPRSKLKGRPNARRWAKKGLSDDIQNLHSNIYRRLKAGLPAFTMTHVRKTLIIHPTQDRLLSIREAARLQGFPDWFRFEGSLSQCYQQIADAVPPPLAESIARGLAAVLSVDQADTERIVPIGQVLETLPHEVSPLD